MQPDQIHGHVTAALALGPDQVDNISLSDDLCEAQVTFEDDFGIPIKFSVGIRQVSLPAVAGGDNEWLAVRWTVREVNGSALHQVAVALLREPEGRVRYALVGSDSGREYLTCDAYVPAAAVTDELLADVLNAQRQAALTGLSLLEEADEDA